MIVDLGQVSTPGLWLDTSHLQPAIDQLVDRRSRSRPTGPT